MDRPDGPDRRRGVHRDRRGSRDLDSTGSCTRTSTSPWVSTKPESWRAAGGPFENRALRYLTVYGRLDHGETLDRARAELTALAARLETAFPDTNRGRRAVVLTELQARMKGDRTMPVLAGLLVALAAVILAISCANVAGLMLLRGEARAREIAVRTAMGATGMQLLAESLAETLVLATAGAAVGIPLAWAVTRMFVSSAAFPTDIPLTIAARIDTRVEAITLASLLLVALVWVGALGSLAAE